MKIKVGVSARHVHLTKEDVKILFGNDYKLTKKNDLTQPGQYACNEQVIIQGEKGKIERVRILGPERSKTQVEISKTDSYILGINPPVRNSGELNDAKMITIIGPKGMIKREAAIIATRHIHLTYEDAKKYNLGNLEKVKIRINGEKGGIIDNVYLRVSDNYLFEAHIDLDDANSHLINSNDEVEIII